MNWIDNADSYICPACGEEVSSPANSNFTCPKCGFVAEKDKPIVGKVTSEQRLIDASNEDHFRNSTKMVEYVSIQAVRELIFDLQNFYEEERKAADDYGSEIMYVGSLNALTAMEDGLSDIPAADVRPVAHGAWKAKKIMIRTPVAKNYVCSVCGKEGFNTNFCPNCGADMRGKHDATP